MTNISKAQSSSSGIPIEKVVLYSSGVGYFEHQGQVNGNASTELRFRAAQMNDVLKSLLLQDLDGGKISAVVYPSQDPIDKILGSFDIDLSGNPSLGTVLTQMRGASVIIRTGTDQHQGTILGVEQVSRTVDGTVVTSDAVNIIKGGVIRSLPLSQVDSIEMNDSGLQEEFSRALQAVAQARDQDKKPLQISHAGSGQRRVRVGYIVEAPVWKTSYRLVLPEEDTDKGYLQGWSIVENQTENDWENVELTLVSGRPISFIQDLYKPLYVQRPVVQFELHENLIPQSHERGQILNLPAVQASAKMRSRAPMDSNDEVVMAEGAMADVGSSWVSAIGSVQSNASAGEVGELFQYVIGNVSLPRQRSAMIPVVTEEVEMQRVSIFNQSAQPKHPLHGVRINNGTDLHLMQGPATVLDAGSYAGDARMNELPAGGNQLVSYALDFEMQVDVEQHGGATEMQTARIVNGVLESQRKRSARSVYTMRNESGKQRSVIVEHPRKGGNWSFTGSARPIESTEAYHRFEVEATADSTSILSVEEEQIVSQSIHLTNLDINAMRVHTRSGQIPPKVKEALQQAISLKQKLQQTDRQINDLEQKMNAITGEQERIRENMGSVERNTSYYKRLLAKLESQEDEIEKHQKDVEKLKANKLSQQRDLQEYLRGLNVN